MRCAQKLNASLNFEPIFEALPEVQIELMIARWKALDVFYPTQLECFNLEFTFHSKTSISQAWFLLVQKVAERPFSRCF